MKKILGFAISTLLISSLIHAEDSGRIFIRTLRGQSNAVRTSNTIDTLCVNQTASAKDVQITASNGDFVSFALSNRCGGIVKNNASIIFTKFMHKSSVVNDVNIEEEAIPSEIEIHVEQGDITISRAQPRPSSTLVISTPFGKFYCIGKEIKISVTKDSATAYAFRTPFNFLADAAKNPEYIGIGYSITAYKDGANIGLKRGMLDSVSDEFTADFNAAENAWRNTVFVKRSEDEKLYGQRAVAKTFHLKRPISPKRH